MLRSLKALADPMRVQILTILERGEFSVMEIMDILKAGQSRVSRHLKILSDAGVTICRKDGGWSLFRLKESEGFAWKISKLVIEEARVLGIHAKLNGEINRVLEKRMIKSRLFFSTRGSSWSDIRKSLLSDIQMEDLIKRQMGQRSIVADLGCGNGDAILMLRSQADRFVGVDNSPEMLDITRNTLSAIRDRVDLRLGNLEHLPLRDHEVDGVLLSLVLHHIALPSQVITEAFRVLSKGGKIVLIDFMKHEDDSFREKMGDLWLGFDPEDIEKWLNQAGFEDIGIEKLTDSIHCFVASAIKKRLEA